MRKLLFCSAVALGLLPSAGTAQVTYNMAQVSCADSLAMSPDQYRVFSAWMSGWFNQRFGFTTVGLNDFEKNTASIRQWCASYPAHTVMSVLERSPPQFVPAGQTKIDMSLITCKQYLGSDKERQEMMTSWMSGYFRASVNQPVIDFQRSANNRKRVAAYCKKQGGETLMSAIQKSAT
jgi:hypothetical protein